MSETVVGNVIEYLTKFLKIKKDSKRFQDKNFFTSKVEHKENFNFELETF